MPVAVALPRLSYANAALAEAVIIAGSRTRGDKAMIRNGLRMLDWLLAVETRDGHLSVVQAGGWSPGEARPASTSSRSRSPRWRTHACARQRSPETALAQGRPDGRSVVPR